MQRKGFRSSYGYVSYIERKGLMPVIFLHGLGGTGNTWMKLSHFLDKDFGLYFFDLLGHGRSDKPDIQYTISVQEAIIDEFLIKEGFDSFSLVGNSYGGWISMRFAVDKTEPSHLVLEDSAGLNRTPGESGMEFREQFISRVVRSNRTNTVNVIGNIVENNSHSVWKMKESDLSELKAKTLIIWGKEDSIISPRNGAKLNRLIPGSKLLEIDGGGHFPHIEFSERIGNAVNDFLKT